MFNATKIIINPKKMINLKLKNFNVNGKLIQQNEIDSVF